MPNSEPYSEIVNSKVYYKAATSFKIGSLSYDFPDTFLYAIKNILFNIINQSQL
jgi:hypothetical protein